MTPRVSSDAFNAFFAWAPWVIGIVIYACFYVAKRSERPAMAVAAAVAGPPPSETFTCAQCGRRGTREQVVAQDHGGAVGYICTNCAK